MRGSASAGMPVPVSLTTSSKVGSGIPQPHGDLAFERELEGVGQQVENDLFPHLPIDVGRLRQRRAIDRETDAGALAGRAEIARQVGRQRGKVGRLVGGLRAPRLDAREVEQRVDELEQPLAVALRHGRAAPGSPAACSFGLRQQVFERTEHQGERRAELVAHVAEESGLRAVELGERLGAPALVLQRAHAGDRAGDVGAQQTKEIAIVVVELAPRADSGDEVAVRLAAGRGDLQHRDLLRRFRPRSAGQRHAGRRFASTISASPPTGQDSPRFARSMRSGAPGRPARGPRRPRAGRASRASQL